MKKINDEKLRKQQAEDTNICIIDVRRKAYFDASPETSPGATWHDPAQADEWSKTLPKDKKIVFYCVKGGQVSQSIAEKAQNDQLDACYLEGGINGYKQK